MRLSYAMLPDHPVGELIETIELADELGFYSVCGADETYHKDMWSIFAAAARSTSRIKLTTDVTHVILKDPTIIAQQAATLDELCGGRMEGRVGLARLAGGEGRGAGRRRLLRLGDAARAGGAARARPRRAPADRRGVHGRGRRARCRADDARAGGEADVRRHAGGDPGE